MQTEQTLGGIDVSAAELVVERRRDEVTEQLTFDNDAAGHRKLIKWLGRSARVCLEATGVYHLQAAMALIAAGIEVMVVNPRMAKDFARALGNRSKTDRVDAGVLAEYAKRMAFVPWQAPSDAVMELRELGRRLSQLIQTRTDEKNRLHAGSVSQRSAIVTRDVRQHIAQLDTRIAQVEKAALEVIKSDPDLLEQFRLIDAARGFGRRTAILLLAELAVLDPTMTVKEVVAHAGLDPRAYESGTSVQKQVRISKVGNARIRAVLYMNAMSAVRHDRGATVFAARLILRGKKRKQALVAVMRKLLHGIWIVLQRRVAYDSRVLFAACWAQAESSDSAVAATQPESGEDHPAGRSEAEELRQQLDPRPMEATRRRKKRKAA